MITTKLRGGLGNMLFQISAAYSYAIDNNTHAVFDFNKGNFTRNPASQYVDNIFRNVEQRDLNFNDFRIYYEPNFHYDSLPITNENLCLDGYFQSDKYFKHNIKKIRDLFRPTQEISNYIFDKYANYFDYDFELVSVHVRRDDYLNFPEHHVVCGMDYYNEAISQFDDTTKFLIFSDDINWCKENFQGDRFRVVENEKDYIDFYMMYFCDSHIICASTFSWWSAYLNTNEKKKVIMPKKWFGPAYDSYNTNDLEPEGWIKL